MTSRPLTAFLFTCAMGASAVAAPSLRYGPGLGLHTTAVAALPDGGMVLTAHGGPGVIVTTDARGAVKAARTFPRDVAPVFVSTTASGEIYVGTLSQPKRAGTLLKLRPDLTPLWSRRLMDPAGMPAEVRRGAASRSGGVVLVARSDSGFPLIVSLAADGSVEWSTLLGGGTLETIRPTADGGAVAVGLDRGGSWVVKLASGGNVEWQRRYTRAGTLNAVTPTSDRGFLCAGSGRSAALVMRLDRDGTPVWSKEMGEIGQVHSVAEVSGGFVVTLSTSSDTTAADPAFAVMLLDPDGAVVWQRALVPGRHEGAVVQVDGPEDAMLLQARDGLKLTVGLSAEFLPLLSIDTATGRSDCGWLGDGTLKLKDATYRSEPAPSEVVATEVVTEAAEMLLDPVALQSVPEVCPSGTPQRYANEGIPPARTREFRSRGDDPELEKVYAALFLGRKFADLDERAEKLRRERPSRDPMRPNLALTTFYKVLASEETAPRQERLDLLRAWVAARPESITARLALAGAIRTAVRRGVSGEEATALRLEAERLMSSLGPEAERDPEYWRLRIVMDCGGDELRGLVRRTVELHADPELLVAAGYCLLHDPTALVAYADEAAKLTRDRFGDAMYMWIAYQLEDHAEMQEVRGTKDGFDWNRMKAGFEEMIRIAPEWLPTYHRYAKMAKQHNDHATARRLFERPELEWYDDAVGTWPRVFYEHAREWALLPPTGHRSLSRPAVGSGEPAPRLVAAPPPPPPPPKPVPARPDVTAWPHIVMESGAFLVQTASGPAAISIDSAGRPAAGPASGGSVRPLARLDAGPSWDGPVYVVACRRVAGRCLQTVLEAKLVSKNISGGKLTFQLGFVDKPHESVSMVGGAAVDASQRVFGVVTGPARMERPGYSFFVNASDLANLLDGPSNP